GDARVSSYFGSSHRARTTIWMLLRDHALGGGLELEGGGEQGARVPVLTFGEHFGRGARLHHLAVAHDEETAGERGDHAQIVRDEYVGEIAPLLQRAQKIDHLRLDQHVERARRFVKHDEGRLEHDG